jgi:hypothetical protein
MIIMMPGRAEFRGNFRDLPMKQSSLNLKFSVRHRAVGRGESPAKPGAAPPPRPPAVTGSTAGGPPPPSRWLSRARLSHGSRGRLRPPWSLSAALSGTARMSRSDSDSSR